MLKSPPSLQICISFLVFGLHSYNLFLHFDMIFIFIFFWDVEDALKQLSM